jgi:hypothetical protein
MPILLARKLRLAGLSADGRLDVLEEHTAFGVAANKALFTVRQVENIAAVLVRGESVPRPHAAVVFPTGDRLADRDAIDLARVRTSVVSRVPCRHKAKKHQNKRDHTPAHDILLKLSQQDWFAIEWTAQQGAAV